jgi:hypothetical protein
MTFNEWLNTKGKKLFNVSEFTAAEVYLLKSGWEAANQQWVDAIINASPDMDEPFGTMIPTPEEFAMSFREWLDNAKKEK